MTRGICLLTILPLLGVAACAGAQDNPLVATNLEQVDEDFAYQGEYVGSGVLPDGQEKPIGAQVIAQGGGKFVVVVYEGGLPGAGWKRNDRRFSLEGTLQGETVAVSGEKLAGTISDGQLSIGPIDAEPKIRLRGATRKSDTLGSKPPEKAVVIFDGSGTDGLADGPSAAARRPSVPLGCSSPR